MAEQKVALVTAGGSGMGAACARRLAAEGWAVAVLSHSGKGEALAGELGGFGVTGTNASAEDLKRLVDGALARWGRIDALINSAGHGPAKPLPELTEADWLQGFEVYFLTVVRATGLIAPVMATQKHGAIVNISSAWAVEPAETFPTSAVTRAGLAAYTKMFADRYGPDGVRMNNILPGWIDSFAVVEERRAAVPMGRYGTVDEIAATAAFLVSDGAAYITGQNLRVDGGLMRSL